MKTLANKMTTTTSLIKCILVVMVMAFSTKGFSQNVENGVTTSSSLINKNCEIVISDSVALDSELDFVSWFMGTKQSSKENAGDATIETSKNTKRQLLSSGITVNRILYKVLLKKMVNQDISMA